tara:strand:- start:289 stop:561 length:273 start_codon:yes stop_codon:yes gene_type:complete
MVKINGYFYKKSTRPNKKLMTFVDGRAIHFGSRDMEHYKDRTGYWSKLDHNDKIRRKNYLARSAKITNKRNEYTKDNPAYSNYHARRILW